ncbi:sulfur oxidation c-type cytochrome SoxA [Acidihalobacter aeolianus]|uniref:L-cysteine S-thiosulfotransferase subunit SoxA n=1 Tax=Acidihalobacter aeolianus TaxID=2792603 RepID=A0A1D8K6U7_9GAMM|nr:sulfur oxidation c-type cytochrome SoxA [Acidihalobacter aeolianus]AOV16683.1 sulfur oxidation c-type cytochrome SoxA [Acidihalobacter aeolianus]
MNKTRTLYALYALLFLVLAVGIYWSYYYFLVNSSSAVEDSPTKDLATFRSYFERRFPNVPLKAYAQGEWIPGITGKDAMAQYHSVMSFPPQSIGIANGKQLFDTPFPNGHTYGDCFPNGGIGIRQDYPRFDAKTGQVVTLAVAVNQCRQANGLKPLAWKRGPLAEILAYMASTSDGKPLDIQPPRTPAELAAYTEGKNFFYTPIGKLNLSCADCHMLHSGQRLRAQLISPALGMPNGFPAYRAKWGGLGTLERRFIGCNKKIRVEPFKPQSARYRDLAYFLSYMSNGLPITGPGYRN